MHVKYIGVHDEVFAPGVRMQPIQRGDVVEVSDDLASSLLEQQGNWEPVKAGKSQTAKIAETLNTDAEQGV